MKSLLTTFITLCSLLIISPISSAQDSKITNTEAEAKWHNLLKGDKLDQWRSWRKGSIKNTSAWTVKNGILSLSKSEENSQYGGNIITLKQYPNFEFKFEFKISEAGNSGIKYRSLDNLGLEYQILDDSAAKDSKVVEIEIDSDLWKEAFAQSKYKKHKNFAKQSTEILIQDHGNEVSYRNLLIKELK